MCILASLIPTCNWEVITCLRTWSFFFAKIDKLFMLLGLAWVWDWNGLHFYLKKDLFLIFHIAKKWYLHYARNLGRSQNDATAKSIFRKAKSPTSLYWMNGFFHEICQKFLQKQAKHPMVEIKTKERNRKSLMTPSFSVAKWWKNWSFYVKKTRKSLQEPKLATLPCLRK